MSKRLLFMEDLLAFYAAHPTVSMKFSAGEAGGPLVVQTAGRLQYAKEPVDAAKQGLLSVQIVSSHIGKNRNGSKISREAMEAALPSFSNRPVLAYIHTPDGSDQPEFGWHALHEDNGRVVYDEVPVGVVPESCNARLEDIGDKSYAVVDALIYEDYSVAGEILQREQECAVSVEIAINALSYDTDEKVLSIDDFVFSGVTILGKTETGEDVLPGMEGANIQLADFSAANNSIISRGGESGMEFEENDKKKVDETVDTAEMTDNSFAEEDDEDKDENDTESPEEDDAGEDGEGESGSEDGQPDDGDQDGTDDTADVENPDEDKDEDEEQGTSRNSLTIVDGETTYELSLNERVTAIRELVNATYNSDGMTWYSVTVYNEYVIMTDWNTEEHYKQFYSEDDGKFVLTGDRVKVYEQYLTEEEVAALDALRADYAALVEYKNTAESAKLHDKRQAIVGDAKYAAIAGTDEYKALIAEMDKYSLADLETKVKCLFADYVASGQVEVPQATNNKVMFGTNRKKSAGTYPSLFKSKR